MNRIMRSRLGRLLLLLLVPVVLAGWTCPGSGCCEECPLSMVMVVACVVPCVPLASIFYCGHEDHPMACIGNIYMQFSWVCIFVCASLFAWLPCTENPDEYTATFEQFQLAAIQFCEEYPEECQEAFDTWAESLDTEAEE